MLSSGKPRANWLCFIGCFSYPHLKKKDKWVAHPRGCHSPYCTAIISCSRTNDINEASIRQWQCDEDGQWGLTTTMTVMPPPDDDNKLMMQGYEGWMIGWQLPHGCLPSQAICSKHGHRCPHPHVMTNDDTRTWQMDNDNNALTHLTHLPHTMMNDDDKCGAWSMTNKAPTRWWQQQHDNDTSTCGTDNVAHLPHLPSTCHNNGWQLTRSLEHF